MKFIAFFIIFILFGAEAMLFYSLGSFGLDKYFMIDESYPDFIKFKYDKKRWWFNYLSIV